MAENTDISWCDHTFNPWEGCQKVGPGCDHCYAEARNARFGGGTAINWGPGAPRKRTSAATWKKPPQWNAAPFFECGYCRKRGTVEDLQQEHCSFSRGHTHSLQREVRRRVFCASLADVFDNAVPEGWRRDLFRLIAATPNLDWLLLTKRIGNARSMLQDAAAHVADSSIWSKEWDDAPWPNIWLGATIVNQEEADRDIPKLLAIPARVRFLSMEPLLGPVDLRNIRRPVLGDGNVYAGADVLTEANRQLRGCIDWVIVGGESGPGARPMHPEWARSLRDQCAAAGVPYHFKQWGEWAPYDRGRVSGKELATMGPIDSPMQKFGKKLSGRSLDGVTHDSFPEVASG